MTAEEIYLKLKDELTAENESSSSPERIFIKSEGQTICTLGMNRSHEIIFVEFKPAAKDLSSIEKEGFVHPHPVEMLHDAGWRQAQLSQWEEAEKLLEIINRSYKKRKKSADDAPAGRARKLRIVKTTPVPPQKEKKVAKAARAETSRVPKGREAKAKVQSAKPKPKEVSKPRTSKPAKSKKAAPAKKAKPAPKKKAKKK